MVDNVSGIAIMDIQADYHEAKAWAYKAEHPTARGTHETEELCLGLAQVYAMLALAGAQMRKL